MRLPFKGEFRAGFSCRGGFVHWKTYMPKGNTIFDSEDVAPSVDSEVKGND